MDQRIEQAAKMYIGVIKQILQNNDSMSSVPLSISRIQSEFSELTKLLEKFPKTKSYSLDEINLALDTITFGLIKSSNTALFNAFVIMDKFDLLPGIFIETLGILDLISDLNIKSLPIAYLDKFACGGVNSIEKPSILMNHIYKYSNCPFCKDPVKVSSMTIFVLEVDLKAGITFSTLKQGEKASFHYKI